MPGSGTHAHKAEFFLPSVIVIVVLETTYYAVILAYWRNIIILYGVELRRSVMQSVLEVANMISHCAGGKVNVEMDQDACRETRSYVENADASLGGRF